MYTVNGIEFESFLKAVKYANSINADVIEKETGMRRWTPAPMKRRSKVQHVIVNADGTEIPFSKVRR